MPAVTALRFLYTTVKARFVAEGRVDVTQPFGFRAPAEHATGPRIAWHQGDPNGALGAIVSAKKNANDNPRSLATLVELFTCTISSHDATAPTDELAQYDSVRFLFDDWWRLVYNAAPGVVTIVSSKWLNDRKIMSHGAALQIVATVEAAIPDAPDTVVRGGDGVSAPRGAGILSLLDVDGALETRPPIPSARVATTESIVLEDEQTVDGIALIAGDRVLVKSQTDAKTNGLYLVVDGGLWTRTTDADASAELAFGFHVYVTHGTVNGDAGFELTTPDPITLGTSALVFERTSP